MRRILSGDLGTSFYGDPVIEQLKALIPFTLVVFFIGTLIAFLLGQWMGKATAWHGPGILSDAATFSAVALYTTFPPWLAFLLTYLAARRLSTSRFVFGIGNPRESFTRIVWEDFAHPPQTVMIYIAGTFVAVLLILLIVDKALRRTLRRRLRPLLGIPLFIAGLVGGWFALGFGPQALDILKVAWLPLVTYILLSFGDTMLIMQTSMMDTLKEDYVTLARAKGVPERVVRDRHAARNALLPVLSRLVISFPYLLTGLVIIEDTFNWPGVSMMLFSSLYQQDMPTVMGTLLVVGVISAVARLILDALYMLLDPRVRHRATLLGKS